MNSIKIDVLSSPQAFELKYQLDADGLIWNEDYKWRYNPAISDWEHHNHRSAWVEFTFKEPSLATYYRMKWA